MTATATPTIEAIPRHATLTGDRIIPLVRMVQLWKSHPKGSYQKALVKAAIKAEFSYAPTDESLTGEQALEKAFRGRVFQVERFLAGKYPDWERRVSAAGAEIKRTIDIG